MSNTYTTIQGDMWDLIALKVYGNENQMHILLDANPKYRNTAVFSQGVVLNCPDVKQGVNDLLPPWRQS